ncbi:unnamed protein product [Nyctereutes procyonoides]|uniref:(raccoon dog) hypothetical protein n=1 Tax=Nyctereutes procyonoides TaxID=34880 RepID=A0A811Y4A3_NYCPR|nr:unnamed protein product [Nyctereutes procyonoides]
MIVTERERERDTQRERKRQRHRQREKQASCREPDRKIGAAAQRIGSHLVPTATFISTTPRNWTEGERNSSEMKADLLVINTKDEQQWVDQTPYNESVTFWHSGEPSNVDEHCVMLHFHYFSRQWGWNDVPCNGHHKLLCKMKKIYL